MFTSLIVAVTPLSCPVCTGYLLFKCTTISHAAQ
nr:MAG TPA: hypothetical protein [Caudoviricetes sp.]